MPTPECDDPFCDPLYDVEDDHPDEVETDLGHLVGSLLGYRPEDDT